MLFDSHNAKMIEVDIRGTHSQIIHGDGYFIIPNGAGGQCSFCKECRDTCLGDVTMDIIPDYTIQQYSDEYGNRATGMGITVREFLQVNMRQPII